MKIAKLIVGTIASLYALAQFIAFSADLFSGRLVFDSANAFSLLGARLFAFCIGLLIAIICFRKAGATSAIKDVSSSASFGKTIAVIQLFVCFLPILGLVTSSVALAINWRAQGWPKVVSWIGTSISILITLFLVLCIVLAATVK
jgi:ABC-type proline/glycine betaine transport system permease subunit